MGWIEWCSFVLGGLVFWLLGWLLSWLFRGNTLRLQNQLTEAQTELGRLQADLTGYKAAQSKLALAEQDLAGLRMRVQDFDSLKTNFGTLSKELDTATLKIQGLEGQLKDLGVKGRVEEIKTGIFDVQNNKYWHRITGMGNSDTANAAQTTPCTVRKPDSGVWGSSDTAVQSATSGSSGGMRPGEYDVG